MEAIGQQRCVPIPCCQDCQSCGFNRSVQCVENDQTTCNYACKFASECTQGTTPFETGYSVIYGFNGGPGRTVDAECCGGGNCTCFTYTLAAGADFVLDTFILGLTCEELQLCSSLSTPPCLAAVTKDGANVSTVLITDQGFRDPQTKLFGIQITELGISHDFAKIVFQFHGNLSESEIPIQYAATAEVSPGDFTCLIDTITDPIV